MRISHAHHVALELVEMRVWSQIVERVGLDRRHVVLTTELTTRTHFVDADEPLNHEVLLKLNLMVHYLLHLLQLLLHAEQLCFARRAHVLMRVQVRRLRLFADADAGSLIERLFSLDEFLSNCPLVHHPLLLLTVFALLVVDHALGLEMVLQRFDFKLLIAHVSLHLHLDEAHGQLVHVFVRREVTLLRVVQGGIYRIFAFVQPFI